MLEVKSNRFRTGRKSYSFEKVARSHNKIGEPFVIRAQYKVDEEGVERWSYSETRAERYDSEDMPAEERRVKIERELEAREEEDELGLREFKEKEGIELVQLLAKINPDEDEISFNEFFSFQDVRHDLR